MGAGDPRRRPRLVATDLDGTLLGATGEVSARTRAALATAEAAGTVVVLVTARPPRWVDDLAAALPCHELTICANGALVYDTAERRIVAENSITPELGAELVRRLREALPGLAFAVERGLGGFGHEPAYEPAWPVPEDTLVAGAELLVAEQATKLLARHVGDPIDRQELLRRAAEAVGELAELSTSSMGDLLEMAAAEVSKAFALEALCAELGVAREEVIAFGDMPNDLPMLAWAGWAVAVANAHPDVLAIADEVTASNDDDGVALVLERLYGP